MDNFKYSHYSSSALEGNIYTLASLHLVNGTSKILVVSLKREIYCFEYLEGNDGLLIPTTREISFTYIPTGAEIISIDTYNKSTVQNEFVIGIAIIKNNSELNSLECYLNIYSVWEECEDFNIETVAQNCQTIELNFTPMKLMQTHLLTWNNDKLLEEKVFLLSGSDCQIHIYKEQTVDHMFKELDHKEYFPEFSKYPSPIVSMDFLYLNDNTERLTAFACECGYVRVTKYCAKSKKLLFNFSVRLDNYVSNIQFFRKQEAVNVVVINTILAPIVFSDIIKYGLSNYVTLSRERSTNIFSCCLVADIDFDGTPEILIGNSAKEIMLYKRDDTGGWKLKEVKQLASSILGLRYSDITGDGINELIVFCTKGLHIFQYEPKYLNNILSSKLRKLPLNDAKQLAKFLEN